MKRSKRYKMINYYELLEVSKNASAEVIEKAYKVLAKRYHPDLQEQANKKKAEEKMKLINEAYEVLSNREKRQNYDIKLEEWTKKEELRKQKNEQSLGYDQDNQTRENIVSNITKEDLDRYINLKKQNAQNEQHEQVANEIKQKVEQETRRKYEQAYENYLRSLGYRIKYKWTFKRVMNLIITIVVIILVFTLIYFIPPVRNFVNNLYEENQVFKIIVNIGKGIIDIIANIFRSIGGIFKK